MISLIESFLAVFIPIFVIVDSPGLIPVYLSLTERFSEDDKKRIVNKAVIVASVVLIIFAFFGNFILNLLHITIEAFEVAGGILLFIIGVEMLFAKKSGTTHSKEQEQEALEKENIAIFPLAIPLLTGPGAITTVITLMNISQTTEKILIIFAIILTFLISKIILDKSSKIMKYLGKTGIQVITRISGIIVSAIAVQFVMNGINIFLMRVIVL
ncbi:MAG: MarC family protein [Candidatus Altarchaeaceae archaeon]